MSLDSTDSIERREELAFAEKEASHDRNIRGLSLVLGAAPTAGVMARLLQSTQGYKTGVQVTPQPDGGPSLPKILQDLLDAGIQDVLGLVNWLKHQGFLPSPQQIAPFIQSLIDAGVSDINSLTTWILGNKTPPPLVPKPISQGGPTIWNRFGPLKQENDKILAIAAAAKQGATAHQLDTASWAYFSNPQFSGSGGSGWYLTVY